MADHHDDSLNRRKDQLEAKLAAAKDPEAKAEAEKGGKNAGYSQAMKLSSEFVAAILVGGAIGYLLDLVAPTRPFGLIAFVLLGFCSGVLNVMRSAGVVKSQHPVDRLGELKKKDRK
ncbi:AtpZ/AtpI family protein [Rhizobium alvei]|uniref:ATP synthase protein I n=1 Tax=Rhizobium alvei TaxID=1132659 RepID=A0ABT8YGV7_9HYPH|nr:AtpZ/AtpI family protein [Rhizobium alvei]MDO6962632.1 AtpZ/AtpI family protein [Rhizobium alvei]